MKIVGAYDSIEDMDKKLFCPFYKTLSGFISSCEKCTQLRYGTIGIMNNKPITKYWCGAGGKPEFMESE